MAHIFFDSSALTEQKFDRLNIEIQANKRVPAFLKELISDIVGMTERNKDLYMQIKPIKSAVQKRRNMYKNEYPNAVRRLFKHQPKEKEWRSFTKVLGKADLSVFGINSSVALRYISSDSARTARMNELKDRIAEYGHLNQHMKKIDELVQYMKDGTVKSTTLLRNAEAIARLLGSNSPVQADQRLTESIDEYISLKYMDQLDAEDIKAVKKFMKSDPEAMQAIAGTMYNLSSEEKKKAQRTNAMYNYQKGYVPSVKRSSGSFIVAPVKQEKELKRRGYKKVEPYRKGKQSSEPLTYYYSPFSSPMFNEGMLQISGSTAGGADVHSGMTGGFIARTVTNKAHIQQLKNFRGTMDTKEGYVPVFNKKGNIIAYQAMMDPEVINRYAAPQLNLAELMGAQLGRQFEENVVQAQNEEIIKKIYKYYKDSSEMDKKQFVNVFDLAKHDPTVADTINLFTPEMLKQFEKEFGSKNILMVPRDLMNDIIGYRMASIDDIFSGKTRLPQSVQLANSENH
jgi:cell division septum initiation protein DivIVA